MCRAVLLFVIIWEKSKRKIDLQEKQYFDNNTVSCWKYESHYQYGIVSGGLSRHDLSGPLLPPFCTIQSTRSWTERCSHQLIMSGNKSWKVTTVLFISTPKFQLPVTFTFFKAPVKIQLEYGVGPVKPRLPLGKCPTPGSNTLEQKVKTQYHKVRNPIANLCLRVASWCTL